MFRPCLLSLPTLSTFERKVSVGRLKIIARLLRIREVLFRLFWRSRLDSQLKSLKRRSFIVHRQQQQQQQNYIVIVNAKVLPSFHEREVLWQMETFLK